MSNASKLESMVDRAKEDYNITSDAVEPNAPDYCSKIEVCRSQIQQAEFLEYDSKKTLENFDGVLLHRDVLEVDSKAWDVKNEFVRNVFTAKSFIKAAPPMFTFKKVVEPE